MNQNTGQMHPGPAVGPPSGAPAHLHTGAAGGPAVSGMEHPAAPRAPGAGGVAAGSAGYSKGPSSSLDMIALGLTIFLVVWQIILMAIAGRTLSRVNDLRGFVVFV